MRIVGLFKPVGFFPWICTSICFIHVLIDCLISMSSSSSDSDTSAPTRELVLCFDGTGNTFKADGTESNILKIFRMLDRTKEERCKPS